MNSLCQVRSIPRQASVKTPRIRWSIHLWRATPVNSKSLQNTKVIRLVFDSQKLASGIEVQSRQLNEKRFIINARKLVVLSASALGSPLILERSRIGRQELATELQVPSVFVNPSVGRNYQDHNLILYPYRLSAAPETTLDGILSGRLSVPEAMSQDTGILKWNVIEGCEKIRPSDEESGALGPEFKKLWGKDFEARPEKPLAILSASSGLLGDHSQVPPGQYLTTATISTYPYSKGHIHATGPAVKDAPDFDAAIFSHKADIPVFLWGTKSSEKLLDECCTTSVLLRVSILYLRMVRRPVSRLPIKPFF